MGRGKKYQPEQVVNLLRQIEVPNNKNIRILAVSVAQEAPKVAAARPLYEMGPAGTK